MIEVHMVPTPNGYKVTIMLEEIGMPYRMIPYNILAGDQFRPEFLAINPNNKLPAIVDLDPPDGGAPYPVFESGAILAYLADISGQLWPRELRARHDAMQWPASGRCTARRITSCATRPRTFPTRSSAT
jgi:GST-like protein